MCAGSLVMGVRFLVDVSFFMGAIFRNGALQGFAQLLGTTFEATGITWKRPHHLIIFNLLLILSLGKARMIAKPRW